MKKIHILLNITAILFSSCASKKFKNVTYLKGTENKKGQPTLNIFTPRNSKYTNTPVLIFVHGGNWNSGDKKLYGFIGRNFAKRGITTVIAGYTLSPKANYNDMAKEIAEAVNWTKDSIRNYKGNPDKIFLTGHSAGGHLIALIGTNPKYLEDKNIIKGIILNDAAGLDMKHYLEQNPPTNEDDYLATWSNNPELWKDASPIYFIDKETPKMMIYLGSKTYESIKVGNERFLIELNKFQPNVKPIILNKKHVPMVLQYIFSWSNRYKEIIEFIEE
ncbi:alpha/beta hydrolase fold domain-containing protein [Flavobacterium ponti]|uniref:Alpha/beta hydrolase fold domain-containing protein n=1 Tax=Flavobacterium ponti TaxID=665133 RepID=A0ABV9P624_9FLAO